MKRIGDFPEPLRHALALWGAFRNLGFSSDDIFFGFDAVSGQPDWVHVRLRTQGMEFVACAAQLPGADRDDVFQGWLALTGAVHRSSLEERELNYRSFMIGNNRDYFAAFVGAIQAKGIVIPELVQPALAAGSASS